MKGKDFVSPGNKRVEREVPVGDGGRWKKKERREGEFLRDPITVVLGLLLLLDNSPELRQTSSPRDPISSGHLQGTVDPTVI